MFVLALPRLAWTWLALVLLAGCASLPDQTGRAAASAMPPRDDSPLVQIARASVTSAQASGFRLLASPPEALHTRLELIDRARHSVDLQVYQFKGDASGRRLLAALREAAGRGVRVRVLVDDLYNVGNDPLLAAFVAHEGVEVRYFNPFLYGRQHVWTRLAMSWFNFDRLHRRMHNKLLVVDGAFAIAGGRNIADEYFVANERQLFFDVDVLAAGAVVAELAGAFDPYWNSRHAYDLRSIVAVDDTPAALRAWFAARVQPVAGPAARRGDAAQIAGEFDSGRLGMHEAQATVLVDLPEKIERDPVPLGVDPAGSGARVRAGVAEVIRGVRRELVVVSPYLIPGPSGVESLRAFRQRGVKVTLMTNSLATTDEPLVHLGYRRYRSALVREGVELYEWSPAAGDRVLRQLIQGEAVLRLHAKCALVDRQTVYLGSMNFDPRSRDLNTELGLTIRSATLAAELHELIEQARRDGSHRVLLAADGQGVRWVTNQGTELEADVEPGTDFWSRLLLDLLSPFVPEEML